MNKRVPIYTRFSTDTQTIGNRHLRLQAVVDRLGWNILAILADEGFEVEVLTGDDAESLTKAAQREQSIATFKEMWWLVPMGTLVLRWLF